MDPLDRQSTSGGATHIRVPDSLEAVDVARMSVLKAPSSEESALLTKYIADWNAAQQAHPDRDNVVLIINLAMLVLVPFAVRLYGAVGILVELAGWVSLLLVYRPTSRNRESLGAICHIASIDSPRAVGPLLAAMTHRSKRVRRTAVLALANRVSEFSSKIADQITMEHRFALRDCLDSRDVKLQLAALAIIRQWCDVEALSAVRRLMSRTALAARCAEVLAAASECDKHLTLCRERTSSRAGLLLPLGSITSQAAPPNCELVSSVTTHCDAPPSNNS